MSAHDPAAVRALAQKLIANQSVSANPFAPEACTRALLESFPAGIEKGTWETADGRQVVWAGIRGRSPRTLLLLGHHDTVGYDEYASLGAPAGEEIALNPEALRERLLAIGPGREGDPRLEHDLSEEWHRPGTWMFGRGALDMKSGLAAGITALDLLSRRGEALSGNVLMISTPDEEHLSLGMRTAIERLPGALGVPDPELIGVLNLDFVDEPGAYLGAMGKSRIGVWILGVPAHAGVPFEALDASQIAAELALRATLTPALADRWQERIGPPAVALRLSDFKQRYDVQTVAEAALELNVLGFGRPLDQLLARVSTVALAALREVSRRSDALRGELGYKDGRSWDGKDDAVITFDELERHRHWDLDEVMAAAGRKFDGGTKDDWTLEVRSSLKHARLRGPKIVIRDLPPFYPAVPPADGALSRAAHEVLGAEGLETRAWYPYITDASLLAEHQSIPRNRGLDIVTLGPWGRDAHGLFERVHAPYAFEKLPRLIAEVVQAALRL